MAILTFSYYNTPNQHTSREKKTNVMMATSKGGKELNQCASIIKQSVLLLPLSLENTTLGTYLFHSEGQDDSTEI